MKVIDFVEMTAGRKLENFAIVNKNGRWGLYLIFNPNAQTENIRIELWLPEGQLPPTASYMEQLNLEIGLRNPSQSILDECESKIRELLAKNATGTQITRNMLEKLIPTKMEPIQPESVTLPINYFGNPPKRDIAFDKLIPPQGGSGTAPPKSERTQAPLRERILTVLEKIASFKHYDRFKHDFSLSDLATDLAAELQIGD